MTIFFGYTQCPTSAPPRWRAERSHAVRFGLMVTRSRRFITVDPERDTPALLAEYAGVRQALPQPVRHNLTRSPR
ncbi:SCO family protein [Thauera humireducens]|uniref:SCO family protein n=1 Tax=Thauera humireducens TaxID=1134435 RepID=UPI00311FCB12